MIFLHTTTEAKLLNDKENVIYRRYFSLPYFDGDKSTDNLEMVESIISFICDGHAKKEENDEPSQMLCVALYYFIFYFISFLIILVCELKDEKNNNTNRK